MLGISVALGACLMDKPGIAAAQSKPLMASIAALQTSCLLLLFSLSLGVLLPFLSLSFGVKG
jgi:hypothetical protein